MIPSKFVVLPALPLTPTGKIDLAALPAPGVGNVIGSDGEFVAPRTATEGAVAAIWSELLGLEAVGVEESFFELGGHSLLAVRVLARVRDVFAVEVAVRELFEAPTVAGLAALVEARRGSQSERLGAVGHAPRDRRLPLSPAQERLWFLEQMSPGGTAYVLSLRVALDEGTRREVLERALAEMVRRHEVLRTRFPVIEGRPIQQVDAPFCPDLAVVDLRGAPDATAAALAWEVAQRQRGFDLAAGPLLRVGLLVARQGRMQLVVIIHHIICDGWSLGIFVEELRRLYQAFAAGEPSPLAELPVQYADYTIWQRAALGSEDDANSVLAEQIAYWRDELAALPGQLELPVDRPRPVVATNSGAAIGFGIDAQVHEALRGMMTSTPGKVSSAKEMPQSIISQRPP